MEVRFKRGRGTEREREREREKETGRIQNRLVQLVSRSNTLGRSLSIKMCW